MSLSRAERAQRSLLEKRCSERIREHFALRRVITLGDVENHFWSAVERRTEVKTASEEV